MSFFSTMTDHNPAFYLYSGIPNKDNPVMEDGFLLQAEIQNTIQSIDITKELNKPASMAMSFAYGVDDKLLPLPWIEAERVAPETSATTRKVVLNCAYKNLPSTDMGSREIKLVKQKSKPEDKKYSRPVAGKAAVTGSVKVLTKYVEKESGLGVTPGSETVKFYTGYIRPKATVFNGIISRPTGGGNQDSIIRIQANALSSFTLWGNNPLRPAKSETKGLQLNDTDPLPSQEGKKNKKTDPFSVIDDIKEKLKPMIKADAPGIVGNTIFMDKELVIDLRELEETERTKAKEVVTGKPIPTAPKKTPIDVLRAICKQYNLDMTSNYKENGIEEIVVFAREASFMQSIVTKDALDVSDAFAIYLAYGEAVLSFNWSCTTVSTASGGGATVAEENGKLSIGYIDSEGLHFETSIDPEMIEAWVKIKDPSGTGTAAITSAIEHARANPDAFIAWFIDINPTAPVRKPPTAVGYGQGGITLTLELRWAIPGITPGTLIYFDSANAERMKLPAGWIGFYRVNVVKEKFNPKENIWTQTLECLR
jgi:hypothetical protein